ncbi:bifunctional nuclease domain-containing protein [uncultured Bacteroides sp.]|uniref:bifunctional nuclease domain-containing protein n=1 Tax=uncultured Bacteroides sp. TaxID=162156 RepID=UPI002AAAEB83|nr:bifunctional nuclease domain-containing protein [uncultured Bacteroides sp.]
MDNKVELKVLNISNSQLQANAFALVLEEVDGPRQLPIIIGSIEAQAIAFKLKGLNAPRPFTHDLFVTFSEHLQAKLEQVIIYKAKEGIFYSYLFFNRDGEQFKIDSRTSDAIALALRFGCPIYTTEQILNTEGYIPEVEEEIIEEPEQNTTLEVLKESLAQAIKEENYELASALRDEIKRKEQNK